MDNELRDKLVELFAVTSLEFEDAVVLANYLIQNGVTIPVRCKDCKHGVWDEENEMWKCVESADYDEDAGEWFGFYEYHNGDFFCAWGERRTDEKSNSETSV